MARTGKIITSKGGENLCPAAKADAEALRKIDKSTSR